MGKRTDRGSVARLKELFEALAGGATVAEAVARSGVEPGDLPVLEAIAGAVGPPPGEGADAQKTARETRGVPERAVGKKARGDAPARSSPSRSPEQPSGGRDIGRLTVHADGASRGNPGQAACAAIVMDEDGEELLRRSRRLGVTTNNVAEYEAVLMGLDLAAQLGARDVVVRLDSELVVRQLNGQYKVKHPGLQPLHARAMEALRTFAAWHVVHIPRKENAAADKLVNAALDGKA